jgi:Asp/Glu/hydantoin racemase
LINANTTQAVTELIEKHSRAALGDGVEIRAVTAAFGAAYISSEAAYAVAGHAALDCLERHAAGCDAVLIACFGDPGLHALREASVVPVIGMAEACMREAASAGRFSIVTGGAAWAPILRRLAFSLQLNELLASVRTLPADALEISRHPQKFSALLLSEIEKAKSEDGAKTVIIGGAALAGVAAKLSGAAGVPLIDSVECGARAAGKLCSPT